MLLEVLLQCCSAVAVGAALCFFLLVARSLAIWQALVSSDS
jgi:hypothetical protein